MSLPPKVFSFHADMTKVFAMRADNISGSQLSGCFKDC
jgi:hypothetical protein